MRHSLLAVKVFHARSYSNSLRRGVFVSFLFLFRACDGCVLRRTGARRGGRMSYLQKMAEPLLIKLKETHEKVSSRQRKLTITAVERRLAPG